MGRVLIALLCLASAGGLGYAAFSDRWLENVSKSRHVTFSLLSSKRCAIPATTPCDAKSHTALMAEMATESGGSTAFATGGQATLGFSLLSALLLLVCAGYLLANKRTKGPNGPQHLALVALMVALIGATVFIKLKPGGAAGVGAGVGFWVFGVACVLGIFAAQLASKRLKPPEPEGDLTL